MAPPDRRTAAEARLPEPARRLLAEDIRPRLHAHGGDVVVDTAEGGSVALSFVGACQGCVALPTTYLGVVRPMLTRLPEVTDVECRQVRVSSHARRRLESLFASSLSTSEEPTE